MSVGYWPNLLIRTKIADQRNTGYSGDCNAYDQVCTILDGVEWNHRAASLYQTPFQSSPYENGRTAQFISSLEPPDAGSQLPAFVRPLPPKIALEDVQYLSVKGALSLPNLHLQNALLQCYIECVYPYMPLIDLHQFLSIVDRRDGVNGQISLLLYQSIMFSASAFVDMKYLKDAGFTTRKMARKAFFQKTRVSVASHHPLAENQQISLRGLRVSEPCANVA